MHWNHSLIKISWANKSPSVDFPLTWPWFKMWRPTLTRASYSFSNSIVILCSAEQWEVSQGSWIPPNWNTRTAVRFYDSAAGTDKPKSASSQKLKPMFHFNVSKCFEQCPSSVIWHQRESSFEQLCAKLAWWHSLSKHDYLPTQSPNTIITLEPWEAKDNFWWHVFLRRQL